MIQKFEKEPGRFITVERDMIDEDAAISFKAKGILTYLMGRPQTWTPHIEEIARHAKDKEASVKSGIQELKESGYIQIVRYQDKKGLWGWLWKVCDRPIYDSEPKVEKPKVGNPPFGEKPKVEKQLSGENADRVGSPPETESRKTDRRKIDFDNNKDLNKKDQTNKDVVVENSFKDDEICSCAQAFGVSEKFIKSIMQQNSRTLDDVRSLLLYARDQGGSEGYIINCIKGGYFEQKPKQEDYRYTGARGLTPEEKESDRLAQEDALRITEEERLAAAAAPPTAPADTYRSMDGVIDSPEYSVSQALKPDVAAVPDVDRIKKLNPFRGVNPIPRMRKTASEVEDRRRKLREQASEML